MWDPGRRRDRGGRGSIREREDRDDCMERKDPDDSGCELLSRAGKNASNVSLTSDTDAGQWAGRVWS